MVRRPFLFLFTCFTSFSMVGALSVAPQGGMAIAQSSAILIAQTTPDSDLPGSDSPDLESADLYIGLRGAAVEALQTQLTAEGFYDGPADGVFGLSTQKAVLAFQANAGIETTGRWDEASRQALATALAVADSDADAVASDVVASDGADSSESIDSEGVDAIAADTADSPSNRSRLTKLLMLGLGMSAIAGSLGVGFLIIRRRRKDSDVPEVDNWLSISDSAESDSIDHHSAAHNSAAHNSAAPSPDEYHRASASSATHSEVHNGYRSDRLNHTRLLESDEMVSGLVNALHTSDPKSRREVIWELGQHGHSQAMQPLINLMVEVDSKEKSLILATLSEMGMRALRPLSQALANSLRDDNPEVRKNAIRDLSRVYDQVVQISHLLSHAIEDEDTEVRQTARWALDQLSRIRQLPDVEPNVEPDGRTVLNNSAMPMATNMTEFEPSDFANHRH
ncbi:MAG: peptidoglycan-binding protein [Cyanobacteria bacterium P01_D01_bin.1]